MGNRQGLGVDVEFQRHLHYRRRGKVRRLVVPDNVLFEGGAGETIRRRLLHNFRLPHLAAAADRHFL